MLDGAVKRTRSAVSVAVTTGAGRLSGALSWARRGAWKTKNRSKRLATKRDVVNMANSICRLAVEIGVEDADLRDAIHGQVITRGRAADGFRRRRIVDAVGLLPVVADVGVNPRHLVF